MNTARRANEAMMSGKKLSDYDIPDSIKKRIMARHYTQTEINERYMRYLEHKNNREK